MEHLSTIMRPIKYGYLTKDGRKIKASNDFDDVEWYNSYILQTPQEVINNKLGVCWDDVEFERAYCKKNDIPHSTFFIKTHYGDDSNHTVLVFKTEDNKFYWFEHSWHDKRGIHGPFINIKDIFITISKVITKDPPVRFYKYGKPQYGCNAIQFEKFATKNLVWTGGV